ncbi:MAG TPA: ABC transporter permease [Mycobacteriales bacterium]|jgi:peptide/nickel transport system permease protein|nr:ABC transporter permease [Mycobacteriales bacterium]
MGAYVIRRLLKMIFVLWLLTVVVFILFNLIPQDPVKYIVPRGCNQACRDLVNAKYHFKDPILTKYWHFLFRGPSIDGVPTGLFHWPPSFGASYQSKQPVTAALAQGIPVTASLAIGSAVIWLLMGIPIGMVAATHPRSLRDRITTGFALVGLSMPTFFLGLLLLYFFFFLPTKNHITLPNGEPFFPASGYTPLLSNPIQWAHHLLLPWFTLAFVNAAVYSRMTRGSMLEVLGEDYIRTARSKGLSERRVIYRHGLRSALTPVVTLLGLDLGTLLGGAIITEKLYSLNGVGALAIDAVRDHDLPVLLGTVVTAAFFIVVANLVIDILYGVLDTRVRLT